VEAQPEVGVARSAQELRRNRRFEVHDVAGVFLFDVDAEVLNLSLDGMALVTSRPLQLGRRYSFRVRHANHAFDVNGVVVWCHLCATQRDNDQEVRPRYHAGVRFEDLPPAADEELVQVIETKAVVSVGQQVLGRFLVSRHSSLLADSELSFVARKVSLSGLLVEAAHDLPLETILPLELNLINGLFTCAGRVAYVEAPRRRPEGPYLIGVELVGKSSEQHSVLEDFISFLIHADPD
jgi:hypothetical protein